MPRLGLGVRYSRCPHAGLLLSVEATVTGIMHPKRYAPPEDNESGNRAV